MIRMQTVAVALVKDPRQRFFLIRNPRWRDQYTLPMKRICSRGRREDLLAVETVEDDLGIVLSHARAKLRFSVNKFGRSGRTGEETIYTYRVYEVNPCRPLPPPLERPDSGFASYSRLLQAEKVTWSAKVLARTVMDPQLAVAVITYPGRRGSEYLLTWQEAFGGYFFPSARMAGGHTAEQVAEMAVRAATGYRGPVSAAWTQEVPAVYYCRLARQPRHFLFDVCAVTLPGVSLSHRLNPLENALLAKGQRWAWLSERQLKCPSDYLLSPAVAALRTAAAAAGGTP
jgi:hypothetical protein